MAIENFQGSWNPKIDHNWFADELNKGEVQTWVVMDNITEEEGEEYVLLQELIDRLMLKLLDWRTDPIGAIDPKEEDYPEKLKSMVTDEIERIDKTLRLEKMTKGKVQDKEPYFYNSFIVGDDNEDV